MENEDDEFYDADDSVGSDRKDEARVNREEPAPVPVVPPSDPPVDSNRMEVQSGADA